MKEKYLLILFLIVGKTFAQVGIGTTLPLADLHVAGSVVVQDNFKTNILPTVTATDENFKLLTRRTNSSPVTGEITRLNVDELTVAPMNIFKYRFENLSYDNLIDIDISFETDKYIVGIADFRYIGAPVIKLPINTNLDSIGAFVVRVFESNGTWHLEIRNRYLDTVVETNAVAYEFTLIVYDTSFYRKLPVIRTNLNGNNTGTAAIIPDLY
ncbi:hypothetical protein [Leeuwenhoekiella sp. NPDC079379]|uniref:hypothetical protein n=1 Tax=Leeuwenhoekiella sp. NPDC079379 TaxID=3364122 RepID=UPI0037C7F2E8